MDALFVTRTLPHNAEDKLGVTLGLLAEGRRYVANQQVVKGVRRTAGYIGGIASKEITYGVNGWHPHTHDIEYYERELSLEDFAALSNVYFEYLNRFYSRNGFEGYSGSMAFALSRYSSMVPRWHDTLPSCKMARILDCTRRMS